MKGPHRASRITIIVIMLFATWASVHFRYVGVPGNDWHDAINSDGKSYYEYLRLFLFPEGHPHIRHEGAPEASTPVIRHFGGAAACMAPFVFVAHGYTLLKSGGVEDGYSLHYQAAVGLAALFHLALGMIALRRYLLTQGFGDLIVSCTIIAFSLGTGLITQAVVHPAMSHVYGFAVIALLFRCAQLLVRGPTPSLLVVCAALFALAIWIRPVNGLVLFALPLAAYGTSASISAVARLLVSRWGPIAMLVAVAILSLQCMLWYVQNGSFFAWSYADMGFHWSRPAVLRSLFSARSGLFFYWPLLLLLVPGAIVLWRHNMKLGALFAIFWAAFMYVTASWWNWCYDNFGQRTYVDVLAAMALPFALAIPSKGSLRSIFLVGLVLCTALNLFQSWQYSRYLLLPWQTDVRMYKYIFLATDPERAMALGGHVDMPSYAPRGREVIPAQFVMFPRIDGGSDTTLIARAAMPFATIGKATYFELDVERTETIAGASADARIALRFRNKDQLRPIHSWRMNVVPDGARSEHWHYAFNLYAQQRGDTLEVLCVGGNAGWLARTASAQFSVAR